MSRLRVRPDAGWLNDPNGPVAWRGREHLFFQHNPAAPVHGSICWGHAVSDDLVRWTLRPVALRPTPGAADAAGCWSGCVVVENDRAVAVYTGVSDDERIGTVCLATASDDELETWSRIPEPAMTAPAGLELVGYRDPFVFTVSGRRFALMGAGLSPQGRPCVLVHGCDDLDAWEHLGVLIDHDDPVASRLAPADIWECPAIFELDGAWVLLLSLAGLDHLGQVVYLVGDLTLVDGSPRFHPRTGGLVDEGSAFYAPTVRVDNGRVLLWGWSWERQPQDAVDAQGWAGALTLTRTLRLVGDRLVSSPLALPGGAPTAHHLTAGETLRLPADPVEVVLTMAAPGSLDLCGTRALDVPAGSHRLVLAETVLEVYVEDGPTLTERCYDATPILTLLAGEARAELRVLG